MQPEVLHVDNHILVCRKPAGVPCVPDESRDESLLDAARGWVEREFNKPGRAFLGVVHRLDRPVSGVLVFARTSKAARRLTEAFRGRNVDKLYLGVSAHRPRGTAGRVEQWLWKDSDRRVSKVVAPGTDGAKEAVTRWRLVGRAEKGLGRDGRPERFLMELVPETGRPHQLRVAAASLGAVLLGDLKYGADRALPDRTVALHARRISFDHPTRKERLTFECEPPTSAAWRSFDSV